MNIKAIEREALAALAEEERQEAIDEAKATIREWRMRPLWHRIFPFTITINRR